MNRIVPRPDRYTTRRARNNDFVARTPGLSSRLLAFLVLSFITNVAGAATANAAETPAVREFFTTFCTDCHSGTEPEAGLSLDELDGDLTQPDTFDRRVLIHDRIVNAEMPPADSEQPDATERNALTEELASLLTAADLARRQREGHIGLRRLNREEYENTLHDLLAIETDLKDLLPEDASAFGFDNVGQALSLSSVLLERYLEAADVALEAAIVRTDQPEFVEVRYDYRDNDRVTDNTKIFRVVDDGVVFFSSTYSPTRVDSFRAPAAGLYRFAVSAAAYQSNEPVTFRAYGGAVFGRDGKTHLIGHYDVPPEGSVTEFSVRLFEGESIRIVPYRTGSSIYQIGAVEFPGPGLLVHWVDIEGPITSQWPPERHQRLFGDLPIEIVNAEELERNRRAQPDWRVVSTDPAADARILLLDFLPHAFRRPVSDSEAAPYLDLILERLERGYAFDEAYKVGLTAALCSGDFLLVGPDPASRNDPVADGFTLAERLSYFLWSSTPDETLYHLADTGRLSETEVLTEQVERMLADPRAERFIENFCGQWLRLRDIGFTTPDRILYPEFDELLQVSMVEESERFFAEVLREDLSVASFVDSDFSILNERLAEHYDIDRVKGHEFRKVRLPADSPRGGVLTQAGVLKVTANGTNTSPVVRGAWVLENLMGQRIPPPPANVPAVEPDIRGTTTIREQLAQHRSVELCASCHRRMDPPGFALESFDVIGGWREFYRSVGEGDRIELDVNGRNVRYRHGPDIDASDQLVDGRHFTDINQFKQLLLEDREAIARCITGKLMVYATGAGTTFADRLVIEDIVQSSEAADYGLRTLIHELVQHEAFRQP